MKAEEHPLSQKPLFERITPGPWTIESEFGLEPDGKNDTVIEHSGCPLVTVRGTNDMSCIDDEDEEKIALEMLANAEAISKLPEFLKKIEVLEAGNQLLNDNLCNTQAALLKGEQELNEIKDDTLFWDSSLSAANLKISELEETIKTKDAKLEAILKGLREIAEWNLPSTGKFYYEDGKETDRPISFEAEYGSNGVREYFQKKAGRPYQHSK